MDDLSKLLEGSLKEIRQAKDKPELEALRIKYLGRSKGILQRITKEIPSLPVGQRAGIGTKIRRTREKIEGALETAKPSFETAKSGATIDITAPGTKIETGSLHPLTKVIDEIKEIFHYLGFTWIDGPEAESDVYNFQKLNMPPEHPARDVQQTYYIDNDTLLRTHTSSMQVRYMENHKPPIRVLFPGRCYRRDMPDSTHLPSFYQVEGLLIDTQTSLTELLGSLEFFAKQFFGAKTKTRVYGHYFPYTEPSIEIEVYYPKRGWLEILGAGMVHPSVLRNGGINPDKYQGWAFGMGPDRLAMLKYGISDIRILYDNDLRFLNQF